MKLVFVMSVPLLACVVPPQSDPKPAHAVAQTPVAVAQYIAGLHRGPGALLTVHRCSLDVRGKPTGECYDQLVGANSEAALLAEQAFAHGPAIPAPPDSTTVPAPPVDDTIKAPSITAALAVVNDADTHARIESCRQQYGTQPVAVLRFGLEVAPSGDVEHVELHGDLESLFASCAVEALSRARFKPFVGGAQHYELAAAL